MPKATPGIETQTQDLNDVTAQFEGQGLLETLQGSRAAMAVAGVFVAGWGLLVPQDAAYAGDRCIDPATGAWIDCSALDPTTTTTRPPTTTTTRPPTTTTTRPPTTTTTRPPTTTTTRPPTTTTTRPPTTTTTPWANRNNDGDIWLNGEDPTPNMPDDDLDNFSTPDDIDDSSRGLGAEGIQRARNMGIDVDSGTDAAELDRRIAAEVGPDDWEQAKANYAKYGVVVMAPTTTTTTIEAPTTTVLETTTTTEAPTTTTTTELETTTTTTEAGIIMPSGNDGPTDSSVGASEGGIDGLTQGFLVTTTAAGLFVLYSFGKKRHDREATGHGRGDALGSGSVA